MISRTPYVLRAPAFRFRALVAAAERLPLGGDREVALATLVAARVMADVVGSPSHAPELHRARAAAAKHWFASHPLPAAARSAFQQLADAIQRADSAALSTHWDRVVVVASKVLDGPARSELKGVAAQAFDRENE